MDSPSIQEKAVRLRTALERRYPGVSVRAHLNEEKTKDGDVTYKGWCIAFKAKSALLTRYRLLPEATWSRDWFHFTEFQGVTWFSDENPKCTEVGYHIAEVERDSHRNRRSLTKKMETQVTRLLKPFIRGTWKPPQPA